MREEVPHIPTNNNNKKFFNVSSPVHHFVLIDQLWGQHHDLRSADEEVQDGKVVLHFSLNSERQWKKIEDLSKPDVC